MRLVGPGHVAARNQYHRQPSLPRAFHQLMDRPVLENEAEDEHHPAQGVVYHFGRHRLVARARPQPAQDHHGDAVDGP